MALLYRVSDTYLAEGKLPKPTSKVAQRKKRESPSHERVRLRNQVLTGRTAEETTVQRVEKLCVLIPLSIAACGIGVLAYQCLYWFREGDWKSFQARLALDRVLPASFIQWVRSGDSWFGLNDIVSFVFNSPLALFLLVFGLILRLLIAKTFGTLSKAIDSQAKKSWRC
ncbi:MAG: hypothetical protein ACYSUC_02885 [Planctomycetota bacterium]|jgi:hypothetical protein